MPAVPKASALLRASLTPWLATGEEGAMAVFTRLSDATGAPVTRLMADYAALALGPGRIGLSDYERLRLYDETFWEDADRREVAGQRRFRELALRANFRHDWLGFAANRLVWRAYLDAHGLSVAPVEAIYRPDLATTAPNVLRSRGELREFLTGHAKRPLLAAPAEGEGGRVLFANPKVDPEAEIDGFVQAVGDAPGLAWLLQPRLAPHAAIHAATDGRHAPVRLVTLVTDEGPKLYRAYWKLPGAKGALADLDPRTGRALRVAPADAPGVSRKAPAKLAVPDWAAIKALAGEGARLLDAFGLVGWDIAPTQLGPVILAVSATPDLDGCQLLQRRGLVDADFQAFLGERRRLAAEHARFLADLDPG